MIGTDTRTAKVQTDHSHPEQNDDIEVEGLREQLPLVILGDSFVTPRGQYNRQRSKREQLGWVASLDIHVRITTSHESIIGGRHQQQYFSNND